MEVLVNLSQYGANRPAVSFMPVPRLLGQNDRTSFDVESDFMISAVAVRRQERKVDAVSTEDLQSMLFNRTITALTLDWQVRGSSIEEQAQATLQCVSENLLDSGATHKEVRQVTIYLVENPDLGMDCEKNKLVVAHIFKEMFPECAGKVVVSWIPIKNLLLPELMLEVSAVALLPKAPQTGVAPANADRAFACHNVMSPMLHKGSPSFSHSVRCDGPWNLVFLSEICGDGTGMEEQTRDLIATLKHRMAEMGGSIRDVVSTMRYLAEISKLGEVAKIRTELFEGCRPQSGGIPVPPLENGRKIKLSAIAALLAVKL